MKLHDIHIKLNTLTIFRGLLAQPVFCALKKLCSQNPDSGSARTYRRYAEFVSELYRHTTCLSDYVRDAMLLNDNLYVRLCGRGKYADKHILRALESDLRTLQCVASLESKFVKKSLGLKGTLPDWSVRDVDFQEIYRKKCENIHREGYGIYSKYRAFIYNGGIIPVSHPDSMKLSDLKDYDRERNLVAENTRAFLLGKSVNNALLYGDAGTGKSSTVKAVLNEFSPEGLRLVELKKCDIPHLPWIIEELADNPLKFIIFIDDLSFTSNDDSYATLKAVLEGSVAATSSNCVIYATSNRRHLLKESMSDRLGDDVHLSDTLQETMSLSSRFGLTVTFNAPDRDCYANIVHHYAKTYGVEEPGDLIKRAEAYALRNGGRSPRTAKHFVQTLLVGD